MAGYAYPSGPSGKIDISNAVAEMPAIETYTPPAYDHGRIAQLTQELAAPGLRNLRSGLREGFQKAQYQDNPAVQAMHQRKLLEGYGSGLESVIGSSRGSALNAYQAEYAPMEAASRLGWMEAAQRERLKWQASQNALQNQLAQGTPGLSGSAGGRTSSGGIGGGGSSWGRLPEPFVSTPYTPPSWSLPRVSSGDSGSNLNYDAMWASMEGQGGRNEYAEAVNRYSAQEKENARLKPPPNLPTVVLNSDGSVPNSNTPSWAPSTANRFTRGNSEYDLD